MTPAWPIGIKKSPSTLEIDSRTDMWLKPANERTGNQELSFFWASWRIEGDGAMGISSHLPPLGEGLPRRKPPRGKKRTKAWSPDLRARSKHLDTAMPEDIPWIFSVTCTSIFPFLHKPVWVEFLTHSAVAPARYDKLLSSKAQLKYHLLSKPHQPPCSITGGLGVFLLCSAMITLCINITTRLGTAWGQVPHCHSWQHPRRDLNKQWMKKW